MITMLQLHYNILEYKTSQRNISSGAVQPTGFSQVFLNHTLVLDTFSIRFKFISQVNSIE